MDRYQDSVLCMLKSRRCLNTDVKLGVVYDSGIQKKSPGCREEDQGLLPRDSQHLDKKMRP